MQSGEAEDYPAKKTKNDVIKLKIIIPNSYFYL